MTRHRHNGPSRPGWVAVLAAAGWLTIAAAAAAQPAALSFDPPVGSINCYETYTVDLVVDAAATDLRGLSLVLDFDSDVLVPVSVTSGDLLAGAACDHFFTWLEPAETDSISVDAAALGCSVSGPGALVRIEFAGVLEGSTTLDCADVRLRDSANAPVSFTCAPATIDYTCPVPVARMSWGELKARFR